MTTLPPGEPVRAARSRQAVRAFVQRNYGFRGALRLHAHALGWDLLRAPANVALAPLCLLQRLLGAGLAGLGARRTAARLCARPLMLRTALATEVERRLQDELLVPLGLLPEARTLGDYAGTRAATNEIAATLGSLGLGAASFKTLTPGMLSLAPSIAAIVAQSTAIAAFPLGGALGGLWYGFFPAAPAAGMVALVAVGLMLVMALVTTFAGILTDPLQRALGLHQRRLDRLVAVLEAEARAPGSARLAAPEAYLARLGDLADAAVNALRWFRH